MEKTFEKEFMRRHPDRPHILAYVRNALNKKHVNWEDLTNANLVDVADYIKDHVSPNSAKVYFAILSRFISIYADEYNIPCKKPHDILKSKRMPQENVALTSSELLRVEQYYDALKRKQGHHEEKDVLCMFLLECFTGARASDIKRMTLENIHDGKLSYVSQKTQTLAVIPVHHRVPQLLKEKGNSDYSRTTINRTIKRVCMRCGVTEMLTISYRGQRIPRPKYEYCGSHTARRTFATVLADMGVPILEISQYMGHGSGVSMTERYIKVDKKKVSEAAMMFFNGD